MRLVFVLLCFLSVRAVAQENIVATVADGKAFLEHTVSGGETIYGLSRAFNLEAKDLAAFNKLDLKTGLKEGQVVKVPLTPANLSGKTCASCSPVHYKLQPKEGLYRVGVNFANIGAAGIRSLNSLTSDNLAIGQDLLVGYLKHDAKVTINTASEMPIEKEVVIETAEPVKPVVKPVEKVPVPKVEIKAKEKEVTLPIEVATARENKPDVPVTTITSEIPIKSAFSSQYNGKLGYSTKATAAIFKTTSGWEDSKYYVLMTNVPAGTIVKVVSVASGKTIYAKVLGELPEIKENEGVSLRISNAGAAMLDIWIDEKFQVTVSY